MPTPFPFQSGATLLASQLNAITTLPINDQTASYTLVVGDVGKRVIMNVASANTVTVNNSIFAAGDTIQIVNKGAGVSTVTAGAGVTINTSDSLALAQYQSGQLIALSASSFLFFPSTETVSAGGLVFVTGTSFSGVTSVSLPNDTFSSTYRNYLMMLTVDSTTSASNITGRYRSGGSDISTSVYYQGSAGLGSGGATSNQANSATSSLTLGAVNSTATLPAYTIMLQFYAPKVSNRNKFASGFLGSIAGGVYSFRNIGFTVELATAAAYDSFSIIGDAASALTGVYRVYGYADS